MRLVRAGLMFLACVSPACGSDSDAHGSSFELGMSIGLGSGIASVSYGGVTYHAGDTIVVDQHFASYDAAFDATSLEMSVTCDGVTSDYYADPFCSEMYGPPFSESDEVNIDCFGLTPGLVTTESSGTCETATMTFSYAS